MFRTIRGLSVALLAGTMIAASATPASSAPEPATQRVTLTATGDQGDGDSYGPHLSPDGRHLAYEAQPRRPDGPDNVYLRDLRTGATRLISTSVTGGPVTDEHVTLYEVSAGAGRIALGSRSAQLVPDDTNNRYDGFVHRRR
ncbi:hypothetical protein [Streptomyces sp. UG1]|uniref:hypothetical protein n=1 Tax=Streptomyces sp. UG1 TaxID=3417652 RepID=UPI003CF86F0C